MSSDDASAILSGYEDRAWRAAAQAQRTAGTNFVAGRREGAYVWNLDGSHRLLDATCSGGVHTLGHRNPTVLAAMRDALDRGLDGGLWMLPNAETLALQDALAAASPPELCRSVITLSASQAADLALSFAFRLTGRHGIVAFRQGYHGNTGFSAMATGGESEGIRAHYNLPDGASRFFDTYGDLSAIDALVDATTAAVILEPMDYETFIPAPAGYLAGIAALCRTRGARLIIDETRTGIGRTGKFWMCDADGFVPDMIVCGKGLSGGLYPVAALVTTREIHEACINTHAYAYTSSLGGNELASAVGRAVLGVVTAPGWGAEVAAIAARFQERFATLRQRHQGVFGEGSVQGGIATIGVVDRPTSQRLARRLFDLGVLVHSVSVAGPPMVKFMPVLTAGPGVADEIADALDQAAGEIGAVTP